MEAFNILKNWIEGFQRNSKSRPKGVDHFYDQRERANYQDLFALHANMLYISKMDLTSASSWDT